MGWISVINAGTSYDTNIRSGEIQRILMIVSWSRAENDAEPSAARL